MCVCYHNYLFLVRIYHRQLFPELYSSIPCINACKGKWQLDYNVLKSESEHNFSTWHEYGLFFSQVLSMDFGYEYFVSRVRVPSKGYMKSAPLVELWLQLKHLILAQRKNHVWVEEHRTQSGCWEATSAVLLFEWQAAAKPSQRSSLTKAAVINWLKSLAEKLLQSSWNQLSNFTIDMYV